MSGGYEDDMPEESHLELMRCHKCKDYWEFDHKIWNFRCPKCPPSDLKRLDIDEVIRVIPAN